MKEPEEIKKALLLCQNLEQSAKDALECIESLEEKIMLMKIQMHGDCGVCTNRDTDAQQDPCISCIADPCRSFWVYEDIPEVTKK